MMYLLFLACTHDKTPTESAQSPKTDTDADTDTDTLPDAIAAHLVHYSLDLSVDWIFSQGATNCRVEYAGSGDQIEAVANRVTFDGPYTQTSNTCDATFDSVQPWYDQSTGTALVSFEFDSNLTQMLDWFADPTETERYIRAEWYMYDMYADYDDSARFTHYTETYNDPGGQFSVFYEMDVSFE